MAVFFWVFCEMINFLVFRECNFSLCVGVFSSIILSRAGLVERYFHGIYSFLQKTFLILFKNEIDRELRACDLQAIWP